MRRRGSLIEGHLPETDSKIYDRELYSSARPGLVSLAKVTRYSKLPREAFPLLPLAAADRLSTIVSSTSAIVVIEIYYWVTHRKGVTIRNNGLWPETNWRELCVTRGKFVDPKARKFIIIETKGVVLNWSPASRYR